MVRLVQPFVVSSGGHPIVLAGLVSRRHLILVIRAFGPGITHESPSCGRDCDGRRPRRTSMAI